MRRKKSLGMANAVSLFPFLAVLICTMGVLIVMLVMTVEATRQRAAEDAERNAETAREVRAALADDLELETFRATEIERVRPELQQRLAQQRARRSHFEEETRRILDRVDALRQLNATLASQQESTQSTAAAAADELEAMESELAETQERLEQARSTRAGRPVLYSIVPASSPGGTARRPIYVECCPEGLYLQPGNTFLSFEDFTAPIVAGNPLDAALLATREHWKRYDVTGSQGDPYPLLVIRPGGATAYAIARRAMASWDDEFGYELVQADRQLDWGSADPELHRILATTINRAQQRQQALVGTGQVQWLGDSAQAGGGTRESGGGAWKAAAGSSAGGTGSYRDANQAGGGGREGTENTLENSSNQFNRMAAGTQPGGQMTADSESASNASPDDGADNASSTASTAGQPASPRVGGGPGGAGSSPISVGMNAPPLALQRGADWALRTRTPGATAYRRPIRVECTPEAFVVNSHRADQQPATVQVGSNIDQSIDALVNQIWLQIEDWGMAESGGYWKPVLRVSAQSQGVPQALLLERKLEGSGIEIERLWR